MKKEIIINGQKIEYTLKKYKKAKNLRLIINSDGCLTVSKPWFLSQRVTEKFIVKKTNWILEKIATLKEINKNKPFLNGRDDYLAHKNQARELVFKKIQEFNSLYQYKYSKISIKNQKTRWGSCSSQGNLNFNYKIIFLPELIINYIIVHELCHLKEMNHSVKFWSLVTKTIPDYRIISKNLRRQGIALR